VIADMGRPILHGLTATTASQVHPDIEFNRGVRRGWSEARRLLEHSEDRLVRLRFDNAVAEAQLDDSYAYSLGFLYGVTVARELLIEVGTNRELLAQDLLADVAGYGTDGGVL
jgi:hypothetical protein